MAADRGWQNLGWCLEAGQRYRLQATGLCTVGTIKEGDGQLELESTADGISIDWYRGKPLGRLLAAQWVNKGSKSRFELNGEGAEIDFIAPRSGPLFLKINNPPGQLRECRGAIRVQIIHDEPVEPSPSEQ